MKKLVTGLAAMTLAGGVLTGCGGSGGGESSAYCTDLEDAQAQIEGLDSGDVQPEDLEGVISTFRGLAEEAPDDISAEWETVEGAFNDLETALADAGLEVSDLAGLQNGDIPEDVDQEALMALPEKLSSLESDEFSEAGDAIEEHAKDECGIDLGEDADEDSGS